MRTEAASVTAGLSFQSIKLRFAGGVGLKSGHSSDRARLMAAALALLTNDKTGPPTMLLTTASVAGPD